MKSINYKADRAVRIREDTYQQLRNFGQIGEPMERAVARCIALAEKHKHELTAAEVTE
jgi:hypothetical protein